MNISVELTAEFVRYLDELVAEGTFKSRSEAVRAALRRMMQDDLARQLRKAGLDPKKFARMREDMADELLTGDLAKLK